MERASDATLTVIFSGDYCCSKCGKTYKAKRSLWRHVKQECDSSKPFSCLIETCAYRTTRRYMLKQHMRLKHQLLNNMADVNALAVHRCPKCGRGYKVKRSLWRHTKFECQQYPKFVCPVCPYKAKQKSTVVSHITTRHPDFWMLKERFNF
ncbi:unnamed protein product [Phyllotreta striolata]|uniref:C2H2-type domain-containing protein n=1 Tax=Phyllotreta striolata TaxID=444603 RepID=A0A9N9XRG3_PHYSR|nr:unnamed protein product [Phyllotreta striolata]